MPLPTMSLRAPPEHHQLIRDIATALRTRPELADVLHDVLQTQHDGVACRRSQSSAAVLDFIAESCSDWVRLEMPPRSHSVRSGSDYLRRARTDRVLLTLRDTGFEGG
jgi:hypothetical protein